jgi:hypothetical protein
MRKVAPHPIWYLLILSLLLIAGCNLSPQRSVAPTEVVPGFDLPTPEPTQTPTPRPTVTPLPVEDECNNYVSFVRDVNYPDDTEVAPGSLIVKKWEVKNTGTCSWGPGYVWRLIEDSGVDVPEEFNLYPARDGYTVPITLQIIAPEDPGTYVIEYIPYGPEGMSIGENIYVRFVVPESTE